LLLDDEIRSRYGTYLQAHLLSARGKVFREFEGLHAMRRSLSWRLTKPLRLLRRVFDPDDTGRD